MKRLRILFILAATALSVLPMVDGVVFFDIPQAAALTLTVTKTADTNDGACDADCSLREAIVAANAAAGADTIAFNIPGAGPHTIAPASALPTITQPLTIDGFSQPVPARTPTR
jgi:CSLREA domain-containing protein